MYILGVILGIFIGIAIVFLPTMIAALRGNVRDVLKLNLLQVALSLVTNILVLFFTHAFYRVGVIVMLCNIFSILVSVVCIVIWVVALVKAIRGY